MGTGNRVLGFEHPNTLTCMANLASTYLNQGRCKEVETGKRVLGFEHLNTLTSMANLASTYLNQGRCKGAAGLEVQVVDRKEGAGT